MTTREVYCDCRRRRVPYYECDGCEPIYDLDDFPNEDPPLYPAEKLAGMSPEQLIEERDRQSNIHDAAVDRCEEINSPTIETARARHNLCQQELRRRGFNPYADEPEKIDNAD